MQSRAKIEFDKAWIDYCTTNRLIAYGELPDEKVDSMSALEAEQYAEKRAKQMYDEDIKRIKKKYGLIEDRYGMLVERSKNESVDC